MNNVIIDVREPEEFNGGHVEGAVNIPSTVFAAGAADLSAYPKDAPIILYCRSGGRAGAVQAMMQQLGYTNVENGINQAQVESRNSN